MPYPCWCCSIPDISIAAFAVEDTMAVAAQLADRRTCCRGIYVMVCGCCSTGFISVCAFARHWCPEYVCDISAPYHEQAITAGALCSMMETVYSGAVTGYWTVAMTAVQACARQIGSSKSAARGRRQNAVNMLTRVLTVCCAVSLKVVPHGIWSGSGCIERTAGQDTWCLVNLRKTGNARGHMAGKTASLQQMSIWSVISRTICILCHCHTVLAIMHCVTVYAWAAYLGKWHPIGQNNRHQRD